MKTLFLYLMLATSCCAMDRFEALSMIESADDDYAVGPSGEVSRYQMLPYVWTNLVSDSISVATNQAMAIKDCAAVMFNREQHYAQAHGWPIAYGYPGEVHGKLVMICEYDWSRMTDQQWCLLWRCPARVDHPTKADADYAQRFSNLVSRK